MKAKFVHLLGAVAAVFGKFKNFFVVVEAKSMEEFLEFAKGEKSPAVYIRPDIMGFLDHETDCLPCRVEIATFLGDGRSIRFRANENLKLSASLAMLAIMSWAEIRKRMNQFLLGRDVAAQIRLVKAVNANARFSVRDLFGNRIGEERIDVCSRIYKAFYENDFSGCDLGETGKAFQEG